MDLRQRVRNYFLRHIQTMVGALGRMYGEPIASFMTILVIGVALALPVMLQLLVTNGTALGGRWDNVLDISVYMKTGTTVEATETLAARVGDWPEVAGTRVIDSGEALEGFLENPDFAGAVEALEHNPLPHVVVVSPADSDNEAMASLKGRLKELDSVDVVESDAVWINRFNTLLEIGRRSVVSAFVLLALAVMLIVGNTIRLDIENRREEIIITKLVGGTNAFIRRPFLYYGCWYGLAGGIVAWLIMLGVLALLDAPVRDLAGLYGSDFRLRALSLGETLGLLGSGAVLGWLGAWLAAQRHMAQIEPR